MTLPRVSESFEWVQTSLGPVLHCAPLARIASHCFTTRAVPLASAEDRQALARSLHASRTFWVNQVHGRAIVMVRKGDILPAERPDADVILSNDPGTAIGVRAADCVPLLLADEETGAVAAVHAGWRGTSAGAASAAVSALTSEFGVNPENLVAAIGPSIGPCCYDVGSELVDAFAAAGHARHLIDRWFPLKSPGSGSRAREAGTLVLDVPGANRDQLVLAGVPEDRIYLSGLCTAEHLDVLTSYRVEKGSAGRIAGVIRAGAG
jgi:YfiH family protein